MKVKELIAALQEIPEDHEVLLSSDGEGNRFSKYADWGTCKIVDGDYAHNVDVTTKRDWDDEAEDGLEDEEYPGDDAVILWPV